MPKRRTEHCWPVAHTLDDLLPLIPDPSSFEAGSSLRIERIMLPDVHLQLVNAIAERFCPDNGWQTVYLVSNKYRVDELVARQALPIVIHTEGNRRGIASTIELIRFDGLKPLVVDETRLGMKPTEHTIWLPLPVIDLDAMRCPGCSLPRYFTWAISHGALLAKCKACMQIARASIHVKQHGVQRRKRGPRRHWQPTESQLASRLKLEGLTYKEIARQIGRTPFAVQLHLLSGGYEGTQQRKALRESLPELDF